MNLNHIKEINVFGQESVDPWSGAPVPPSSSSQALVIGDGKMRIEFVSYTG